MVSSSELDAMRLTARVVRTDAQFAVLLPSRAVRAIGVREGDVVDITASHGAIIIRRARRTLSLRELVRRITSENRHDEIRWSPNTGREAW
jgi:antitoxin component of MazEF toxin-antitoxin module